MKILEEIKRKQQITLRDEKIFLCKAKPESSDDDYIEDISMINIDESRFVQPDLEREPLNIVFIGHVGSGKSTTCGAILLSCNKIDKNEIRRVK